MELPRKLLEQACIDADLDPEDAIYERYSGRAMYGDHCVGVVCDHTQTYMVVAYLAVHLNAQDFNLWEFFERTRTDNMGMDIIVYWPGVTLDEHDEDEEEDEDDE